MGGLESFSNQFLLVGVLGLWGAFDKAALDKLEYNDFTESRKLAFDARPSDSDGVLVSLRTWNNGFIIQLVE